MNRRRKMINKIDEEIMRLEEMIEGWEEERERVLFSCPVCGNIVDRQKVGFLFVVEDEDTTLPLYFHFDCYHKNEPMIKLRLKQEQEQEEPKE